MVQTLQNFINGEFVTPAGTELLDVVNPTNGEVVAKSPISVSADIDAAMNAAKEAFTTWKHVTPGQRQLLLLKLADAVEANSDELVEAQHRNTGQVRSLIASEEAPQARTSSGSSPAPHASWKASPPASTSRATPPTSAANRSASWPRWPRGTTRS